MENDFSDKTTGSASSETQDDQSKKKPPSQTIAIPDDALIIIPVRNLVLFPGLVVPISVGRENSVAAAQEAARSQRQIGILLQKKADAEEPGPADLYHVGTVASILRYVTAPDGSHHIICQGEQRYRITEFLKGYPFSVARIERFEEPQTSSVDIEARMVQLKTRTTEILQMLPQAPSELAATAQSIASPAVLTDFVAGVMDIKPEEKQEILETFDLRTRMDKVLGFLVHNIEVLRISQDIDQQTKERFEDRQREILLREQLKTIQKQLGETEGNDAEIAELEEKVVQAKMPDEIETQVRKELKRLQHMTEASAEYSMLRTYLDWVTELPWSITTEDRIDIAEARTILDQDHYGLQKIKRRILEYLAVRKLNPLGKSPILCFVGPPGVGKTSLGQSIAKATGRKFARVSLGGVHDEAEIRGHRRTYIGALPGNIIQAIHKAGSKNCVMMLDEIDKLGSGIQGDPSSALLEVLDPEQNNTFRDNYLAVPFDLSHVMFITTANMLDTIPGPLRDRMEVIALPGYTEEEKIQIAKRYLVRRQMEANGLTPEQCDITDEALHAIIHGYTREAGVRNLEREIGSVLRHAAMRIAEGTAQQVHIDIDSLHTALGPEKFESEIAMRTSLPGVATGLAWTPVGGDILFVEASRTPGSGKLILTGQLGDVMKESAQAALTLVKAHSPMLNIPENLFEKNDIHVHVPAGAIPKDGPSAGVAMFIALASLLANKPVHSDHAMTGEISLRGLVLPIGGVKEKVLAALQAGITTVLLPARNKRDLEDIPDEARNQLKFIWLETVDDAFQAAIVATPKEASGQ
ncbi:MAG TPA: endopeptidase La [Eoetvoesiella sp.]